WAALLPGPEERVDARGRRVARGSELTPRALRSILVRPEPQELRPMPEPVPLDLVVAHLDDHLGPHGRLLELSAAPAVRLGETPLRGGLKQRQHAGGDLVVA